MKIKTVSQIIQEQEQKSIDKINAIICHLESRALYYQKIGNVEKAKEMVSKIDYYTGIKTSYKVKL
jgi:hypothetical protein